MSKQRNSRSWKQNPNKNRRSGERYTETRESKTRTKREVIYHPDNFSWKENSSEPAYTSPRKFAMPKPKGSEQENYLASMSKNVVTFGVGPAGSGKTFLAVAKAVVALKAQEVEEIVFLRPSVTTGDSLGYLPGELGNKVDPFMEPVKSALAEFLGIELDQLVHDGQIRFLALEYARGATYKNAFIVLDEAQNTTIAQMFMVLTRIGEGSKIVVTGDLDQSDLGPDNGLRWSTDKLKPHAAQVAGGCEICKLSEVSVVRSAAARSMVEFLSSSVGLH